MSKYKVGDKVVVHDRGMKTNNFRGIVTGIEPNTNAAIYNVLVEMRDINNKITGVKRNVNFLERQLTKEVESV